MPIGDCTSFLEAANFNRWKTTTRAAITAYQNKARTTQAEDNEMNVLEKDMIDASICVGRGVNTLSSTSSSVAELHETILDLTAKLQSGDKDIEVAKNRVSYISHPEQQTSNYESWFPMNRPIRVFSLVILMSISIFMGIFLLLMIMSYFDLDIMLYVPPISRTTSPFMIWLSTQMTTTFWITLVVLISVIIYFVNRK